MQLSQDDIVDFRISDSICGIGKVCGVSTTEQPWIGRTVILEVMESTGIDKETYPYSHIAVPEILLTKHKDDV